jgi:tRNA G10  N-methylase Trm11
MIKHPAIFSDSFIPVFADLLYGRQKVLDPFAGTGKLALIKDYGFEGKIVCNEIESEWANESTYSVDEWHIGDAANMSWARDEEFNAICTSPTYGNRMADHHNAKDASRRITYKHMLGRDLHPENTGAMQWGTSYKTKHIEAYQEMLRVLSPDGRIVINISDHIRKGKLILVSDWHTTVLKSMGLVCTGIFHFPTKRMRFGENAHLRAQEEYIIVFDRSRL